MSEYQYYAFKAIDRPLGAAGISALRALSTRALITETSFANSYDWGDFHGDPLALMRQWFDLHLYLASWGTRRLMIRLPATLIDRARLAAVLQGTEWVTLHEAGDNLIVDIWADEVEDRNGDDDDGSGWIDRLAPLRAALFAGDLRPFYLVWLGAVAAGTVPAGALEPMPGLGPLTPALEAFADFFAIDPDLVAAAAERDAAQTLPVGSVRDAIASMPEAEKVAFLVQLADGEPHVGAKLHLWLRRAAPSPASTEPARSAGALMARAGALRQARERAEAARIAAAEAHRAAAEAAARRRRLAALRQRGETVWHEVEAKIGRRHGAAYDRATACLADLRAIAEEDGTLHAFEDRLRRLRARYAGKPRLPSTGSRISNRRVEHDHPDSPARVFP